MLQIIPFRARHVWEIGPWPITPAMAEMAYMAEQTGPAFSGCLYGRAIGAGGVSIQQPGIGEAWTLLTPLIRLCPLALHRAVKSHLVKIVADLDEVWAVCSHDEKWLHKLGFKNVSCEARPDLYKKLEPNQVLLRRTKWKQS